MLSTGNKSLSSVITQIGFCNTNIHWIAIYPLESTSYPTFEKPEPFHYWNFQTMFAMRLCSFSYWLIIQGPRRGRGGGALASPLFCKNKNKLNKKWFNKSNGVKNNKKSLIRKWPELLAKTNAQINRQNETLVVTIVKYFSPSNLAEVKVF